MALLFLTVLVLFGTSYALPCTQEDYRQLYTECDSETNTRTLVAVWVQPHLCDDGNMSLPEPIPNLPCEPICGPGTYLPLGSAVCQPCDPGYFSVGGGLLWNIPWTALPEDFVATCTPEESCSPWDIAGGLLESGNQTMWSNALYSKLELNVQLVSEGFVQFEYMVDAGYSDGLLFFVGGACCEEEDSIIWRSNFVEEWTTIKVPLEAGCQTLRWVYYREADSIWWNYHGILDKVMIRSVEVVGTHLYTEQCRSCPPGSYQDVEGKDTCLACPVNTYANASGASVCTPCPDGSCSVTGQIECVPRKPCEEDDMEYFHTACNGTHRWIEWQWMQPQMCDEKSGLSLPERAVVPCGVCSPGSHRVDQVCTLCPMGSASPGGNVPCAPCDPGTEAVPHSYFHFYDSHFPDSMKTGCSGECGTQGWRVHEDRLDSGSGHGMQAESWLEITTLMGDEDGLIDFSYQVDCTDVTDPWSNCYVEVSIDGKLPLCPLQNAWCYSLGPTWGYWNTMSYAFPGDNTNHTIKFAFFKWNNGREDTAFRAKAIIANITVFGDMNGGAESCTLCPPGRFSQSPVPQCSACPIGYNSIPDGTDCALCPENTFNEEYGKGLCIPCGHATVSNPDRSGCVDTCSYTVPELPHVTYDMSGLVASDEMYGPIDGYDSHIYFINVCSKNHNNHSCHDPDGNPIISFACQITTHGYGVDLGHVIGFHTYAPDPEGGVIIQYTHGTQGCAPRDGSGPAVYRETNVTMICDPSVGIGQPQAPDHDCGVECRERDGGCRYNLIWRSVMACPLCTADHMGFFYSECNPDTGLRDKSWYWLGATRHCHDGMPLPSVSKVPCAADIVCDPGQVPVMDASNQTTCQPAPKGYYSAGDGVWINNVSSLFASTRCSEPCTPWTGEHGELTSGQGVSSQLVVRVDLAVDGSVQYDYTYLGDWTGTRGFTLSVDGQVVFHNSTWQGSSTMQLELSAGSHELVWEHARGDENAIYHSAVIRSLLIRGVYERGQPHALPCPAGMYSDAGATMCSRCPRNTAQPRPGEATCSACTTDEFQWSLPGSIACQLERMCEVMDVEYAPGACTGTSDGLGGFTWSRWVHPIIAQPASCTMTGSSVDLSSRSIPCSPCSPGMIRRAVGTNTPVQSECVACPAGQFVVPGSDVCQSMPGAAAIRAVRREQWDDTALPDGWSTWCRGDCDGAGGWRALITGGILAGDTWSSGHSDAVVQWVAPLMVEEGTLEVVLKPYDIPGLPGRRDWSYSPAVQMAMDGVLVAQAVLPASGTVQMQVPVPVGRHVFTWNFRRTPGSVSALLSQVTLCGAGNEGGAWEPTLCQGGTYATTSASACSLCAPGTFSLPSTKVGVDACSPCIGNMYQPEAGQQRCLECGQGTFAESDRAATKCLSTCRYTDDAGLQYDMSALNQVGGPMQGPVGNSRTGLYYISLCSDDHNRDACLDESGAALASYMCEEVDGIGISCGRRMEMTAPRIVELDPSNTMSFVYKHGDTEGCPADPISGERLERESVVNMLCDVEAGIGSPVFISKGSREGCVYEFDWASYHACRLCTPLDWDKVRGECVNGSRLVYYVKKSGIACFGDPTMPSLEACDVPTPTGGTTGEWPRCDESDTEKQNGECINGQMEVRTVLKSGAECVDGARLVTFTFEACTAGQIAFPTGAVVGSGVGFMVIIGGLTYLGLRNRRIAQEYRMLKQSARGAEMDYFGGDDEDVVAVDGIPVVTESGEDDEFVVE